MRAFLKIAVPTIALVLTTTWPGAQALELHRSSPEACLARYGSAVAPTKAATVSDSCQRYLFPPAPKAPALAHYTFGGNTIRQVAQACADRFGDTNVRMADVVGHCRVFYYPDMSNPLISDIKLPPKEAGGLY